MTRWTLKWAHGEATIQALGGMLGPSGLNLVEVNAYRRYMSHRGATMRGGLDLCERCAESGHAFRLEPSIAPVACRRSVHFQPEPDL
jgi:hypothetical protein